jgi:hypothetical protein
MLRQFNRIVASILLVKPEPYSQAVIGVALKSGTNQGYMRTLRNCSSFTMLFGDDMPLVMSSGWPVKAFIFVLLAKQTDDECFDGCPCNPAQRR